MGIQINGNNDIISALDGSWTAEGASINTSGILTATTFEGNVTGTACTFVDGKFTGNVTIGGTLTYEDVTNIDSVGVITARAGINLTGGNITLGDSGGNSDDKLVFGEHGDLKIFHNGSNNYIDVAAGSGHLYIRPKNNLYIQDYTNGEVSIDAFVNGKTGLYYNGTQRLATSGIGATVFGQLDIESAGSYIKSNQLKFNPSGDAHIDHGTNNKDIYFRLSKSSALDTTMMQIDSSAEITKFRKYITVGLQGGADTAQLGGGSGVGAYLQLNYASGGIVNTKLLGNGNSWLNSNYGNLGIGTNNPTKILDVIAKDGVTQPYIEKQSGSTNNTYRSALTLSARSTGSAAANYGPAIGFQHCFGGSNYAGCQIASQCGSDTNTASIRFYPRNYGYTEAMRISHNGLVNIGAAADNTAIHASGPFSGATPKFEIKLGGAANSYKRLINITNPGAQTGSETLGRVGIKLSLGSEASGGESNKSGAIYAESTSGYNNGTALCLATANAERLRITSVGDMGLGTISPDGRLHISSGTANSDCVVIIEADTDNNDENANAQIWFKQDGDITGGFVGQSGNKLVISNNISSSGGISFRTGTTDNTGTTDPLNGATETLAITSDGKVGIGEDDPDGNKLLIRAGSTVGTNKGHIMLTGDSATNGQGPQIVFSESGSGSSYAGAYIGHVRTTTNSVGDLVFGTRATGGDANTIPTERLRIDSNGYLSFAGDTNTYIWHPQADQIAITKGGGSFPIIRFGSGGAGGTIAIGNTTANLVTNSEILSVRGYSSFKSTTNNYAAIYTHNEGNTSGTYNAHILWNAGGANRGGIGYMPNTGDVIINNHQALIFATGGTQFSGTERLHITSDGAIENTYVDEKRGIAPIFRDYVTLNNSWQNIARISGYANATMFRFVFEGQASGTFWNGYADIMVGHYRQYKCKLHNGGSFPVSVRLFGNGSGTCDLQVKSEGGNSGTLGFNIIPSTFEADNTVVFTSSGTMSDSNLEIIGVKGTVSKSYQEKADDFKVWGSIQSGSTSEPAILKTNSNGGIIYFEHYFNCVKGGSGNSHTVNQDIVTVTGIGNFHQAIWTAQFGTRLQGQSDSWTRVGMWQTAANRFNGGSNFNFQEEWITGDSAVQQYSNIHLYEVSSTEYRLRMNWPSGTYGSSFCSGKVHCSFVNDVEDRSNVTFAYGHN